MEKRNPLETSCIREILNRAVVDPKFREQIFKSPETTLKNMNYDDNTIKSIKENFDDKMLDFIKSIENQIDLLSENVLCSGGGSCGIA